MMTINFEIPAEKAARLQEIAGRQGQTIGEYLLSLAEREALAPAQRARMVVEELGALAAMNASTGMQSPTAEALRRENMYEARR